MHQLTGVHSIVILQVRSSNDGNIRVKPTWEKIISPDSDSLLMSDEIENCTSLETSPDFR